MVMIRTYIHLYLAITIYKGTGGTTCGMFDYKTFFCIVGKVATDLSDVYRLSAGFMWICLNCHQPLSVLLDEKGHIFLQKNSIIQQGLLQ